MSKAIQGKTKEQTIKADQGSVPGKGDTEGNFLAKD